MLIRLKSKSKRKFGITKQIFIFDENIAGMKLIFDSAAFSKQVKQKRVIDEDLDMRSLAKKIKISAATISRCENGYMPDLDAYAKLCYWIGKSMNDFIKFKNGR